MLLNQFKNDLVEFLLDLAWQHWTTLGVDGQQSAGKEVNVDPEALVLLVGFLGSRDIRLVENVINWLITNEDLVFKSRLKTILKIDHPDTLASLNTIVDTINQTTGHNRWQSLAQFFSEQNNESGRTEDGRLQTLNIDLSDGKTAGTRLTSNRLHLRKLFGTSTRAELLNFFIAGGEGSGNAIANNLQLSQSSVYTILQDFLDIGLLNKQGMTRSTTFRFLPDRFRLEGLHGERFFNWPNYFSAVITAWHKIEQFEEPDTDYKQRSALNQFNSTFWGTLEGWNQQFQTFSGALSSPAFMEINDPADHLLDEITSLPSQAINQVQSPIKN